MNFFVTYVHILVWTYLKLATQTSLQHYRDGHESISRSIFVVGAAIDAFPNVVWNNLLMQQIECQLRPNNDSVHKLNGNVTCKHNHCCCVYCSFAFGFLSLFFRIFCVVYINADNYAVNFFVCLKNKIHFINNTTMDVFDIKPHSFCFVSILWWLSRFSCVCMMNLCIWFKFVQEISIMVHVSAQLLQQCLVSVYNKPWHNTCLMGSKMVAILVQWLGIHIYVNQISCKYINTLSVSINKDNKKHVFKSNTNKMNNKRCILQYIHLME